VVLEHAEDVLGRVQTFVPNDSKSMQATLSSTEQRLDALTRRTLLYVALLAAAWTALFWVGYVVAKRMVARRKPGD